MPAPKRRNEGVTNGDNEPQTKRRSARQAAQKVLELDSPVKDEPRKAVKGNKGIEKRKSAGGPSKSDLEAIGAPGAVSKTPALKSRSGATAKAKEPKPKQKKAVTATKEELDARNTRAASEDPDVTSLPDRNPDVERHDGEWYWLMKAEPESRLENGIDVKFSIDDLRQKSVPEPWDGKCSFC
jgi:hypothetical protein